MSVEPNKNTVQQKPLTSAEVYRVLTGMQDALADEMIARLTDVINQTLLLFESLNQAGLDKLLTMLAQINKLLENFEQSNIAAERDVFKDKGNTEDCNGA